ncbi:hypothetical protein K439DRAFT_1618244 [Ramaria rubella]|nr:hypothetical protein K439DRAFT_1618244 [Ramaria rubella]
MTSEGFGLPADVGVAKTCGSGKGTWGGVRVPLRLTRGNCFHLHMCWGHAVVAADAWDTGGYRSVWRRAQGHKGVYGGGREPLGLTWGASVHLHMFWGHTVVAADAWDAGGYRSAQGRARGHKGT